MMILLFAFATVCLACNVVSSWNNVALDAIRKAKLSPPVAARTLAIFNVAIYDATMSLVTDFKPYKYSISTNQSAIVQGAIISAARKSLSLLFPDQVDMLTAVYNNDISAFNASLELENGIYIGTKVAERVFNDRLVDGSQSIVQYGGSDLPGKWRPTPAKYADAEVPQYAQQKPWCIPSHDAFRPPAPPAINSAQYLNDHNQIYRLGALNGSTRTPDQTEIAAFWFDGPATDTPPGTWAVEAGDQICARRFTLAQSARLFAMISVSLADAAIMGWDAKYTHGEWRPITAIRFANTTGIAELAFDAEWWPLLNTPNWPDFPSDRAMFGGAASRVLGHYFGHDTPLTVDADNLNISRAFANFAAAAFEQAESRVFAGSHFNHSVVSGLEYGGLVGDYVFANCFQQKDAGTGVTVVAVSNNVRVYQIAIPIAVVSILIILICITVWYTMRSRRSRRQFVGQA